jgi:hypothetical protein
LVLIWFEGEKLVFLLVGVGDFLGSDCWMMLVRVLVRTKKSMPKMRRTCAEAQDLPALKALLAQPILCFPLSLSLSYSDSFASDMPNCFCRYHLRSLCFLFTGIWVWGTPVELDIDGVRTSVF